MPIACNAKPANKKPINGGNRNCCAKKTNTSATCSQATWDPYCYPLILIKRSIVPKPHAVATFSFSPINNRSVGEISDFVIFL